MVVLHLALLVGPIARADACFHEQLVTLSTILGDCLPDCAESDEPKGVHNLPRVTVLVTTGIVIANDAQASVGLATVSDTFRIASKVADSRESKAIHGRLLHERKCSPITPPPRL